MNHRYAVQVTWEGNRGVGTRSYRAYGREHTVRTAGKHPISGSADRAFHGDADRWNPEELLLAALSQCHMLSYLHAACRAGVVVTAYEDAAAAELETAGDGGRIVSATLRPRVTVAEPADPETALGLHEAARANCFIAASVAFPVHHEPTVVVSPLEEDQDRSPS